MITFLSAATTVTMLKVGQILIACAPAVMSIHHYCEKKSQEKKSQEKKAQEEKLKRGEN